MVPKSLLLLVPAWLILNLTDYLLTAWGLQLGAVELNPLYRAVGEGIASVIKFGGTLAVFPLLWVARKRIRPGTMLGVLCMWLAFVNLCNVHAIILLLRSGA